MNGIEQAIKAAGSLTALAKTIGTSAEFVHAARAKGFLPPARALIAAREYGIDIALLVKNDVAQVVEHARSN